MQIKVGEKGLLWSRWYEIYLAEVSIFCRWTNWIHLVTCSKTEFHELHCCSRCTLDKIKYFYCNICISSARCKCTIYIFTYKSIKVVWNRIYQHDSFTFHAADQSTGFLARSRVLPKCLNSREIGKTCQQKLKIQHQNHDDYDFLITYKREPRQRHDWLIT